jgi:hypothetical protein
MFIFHEFSFNFNEFGEKRKKERKERENQDETSLTIATFEILNAKEK